ncbi:MAG: hypothetical protein GX321_06315 [Clostridiales bacterium]|nr:hypothetical protein [Clostridiales bacterium]
MSKDKRVVKFKKRKTINIGIIIFLILFLYIAINIYIYFTKEHISIYEVDEGFNIIDNRITGLILRDEELVSTPKAGFIYYFHNEGDRVAKNSSIYSVDESTEIIDIITSQDEAVTLSTDNIRQFQYKIKKFHENYSDSDFTYVYNFKDQVESTMLDILNENMLEKGLKIQEETGFAYTYEVFKSNKSGVISYYLDNLESIRKDNIIKDLFITDNYLRKPLRSSELIAVGTPVYKLVTSELWSIILPITNEQYEKLLGKDKIDFTILNDGFTYTAPVNLFQSPIDLSYYAELIMDKHLSNYLEYRYLDIELHLEAIKGLKIPLSAVTTKEFYMVPLNYFTSGGNTDEKGLVKEEYDKDTGKVKLIFVSADIYYQNDTYGYVDTNQFAHGTWIQSTEGNRYQLSITDKLTGVYNVNMGYAVFNRIEIIYQNESYCIIKKDTSYGLSQYDHIALDYTTVVEQKIIY